MRTNEHLKLKVTAILIVTVVPLQTFAILGFRVCDSDRDGGGQSHHT